MLINVTKECINEGLPRDCAYCPVALAIIKAMPGAKVKVNRVTITIIKDGRVNIFMTPINARNFIDTYDRKKYFDPIQFEPFTMELSC